MKPSGIPWLADVPQEWEVVRGKYCMHPIARPIKDDDGVITCFRDGEVTLRSKRREEGFTVSMKELGYQGIEPGDLVVHGMDGFAGSIGVSDSRGKASPVLIVLDSEQDKRFLMYYLRAVAYRNVFVGLASGIRVRSCDLRWPKLAELPMLLPPLNEQRCIAKWLDGATARIDSLKEKIAHEIELLDGYKHSFISEAVMGRIPQCTRTFKPSGIPWVREVPKEWKVAKVGYLLDEINRRSKDGQEEPLSMSQKLGIVPSREIEVANPASSYVGAKIVSPGDLVLNKLKAHLGVFAISKFEGLVSPDYAVYRAKEGVSVEYLNYVFHTPACISEFKRRITGVAVGFNRLYTSDLFKVSVPFPPLREQREIAAIIKKRCEAIDSVIAKRKAEGERLDALRRSLIVEAVTGKKAIYQGGVR